VLKAVGCEIEQRQHEALIIRNCHYRATCFE
jgi:hypothetical protein